MDRAVQEQQEEEEQYTVVVHEGCERGNKEHSPWIEKENAVISGRKWKRCARLKKQINLCQKSMCLTALIVQAIPSFLVSYNGYHFVGL